MSEADEIEARLLEMRRLAPLVTADDLKKGDLILAHASGGDTLYRVATVTGRSVLGNERGHAGFARTRTSIPRRIRPDWTWKENTFRVVPAEFADLVDRYNHLVGRARPAEAPAPRRRRK